MVWKLLLLLMSRKKLLGFVGLSVGVSVSVFYFLERLVVFEEGLFESVNLCSLVVLLMLMNGVILVVMMLVVRILLGVIGVVCVWVVLRRLVVEVKLMRMIC